jgi:hypothetical protein
MQFAVRMGGTIECAPPPIFVDSTPSNRSRRLIGRLLKHNLMGIGGFWANIKIVPGRPRH